MRGLAHTCFTRRRAVLAIWLASLVVLVGIVSSVGTGYSDSFRLKGTESVDAINLLRQAAPRVSGDRDQIVVATQAPARVGDPAVRARVTAMLAQVAALPHVSSVVSPYAPGGARQIAPSGSVAYAAITFDGQANDIPTAAVKRVVATAQSAGGGGLEVELGGQAIQRADQQKAGGTFFGFVAAFIVLLIFFGAVLAAVLPLITAGIALGIGLAVDGLLSHLVTIATFSTQLSILIGLGVGVDYALFIVTRYRQGLERGLPAERAIADALDTSGRAVFFAGIIVCIALLGMIALGVSFLYGVAIAAAIAVAFTVLASLTLLPALLGFFGPRVLGRRRRRALAGGTLSSSDESAVWVRWANVLARRPALLAGAATVLMLVIAIPFLSLRLGSSDQGSDPAATTTRKAYDLLARGFGPGSNGPLQLVARVSSPAQRQAMEAVVVATRSDPQVASVGPPTVLSGGVALAQVIPRGSPQASSTTALVGRLRHTIIPRAAGSSGLHVLVGGNTAIFDDFSKVLTGKLPLFIGVVVVLSFLLLMAVFRSVVVPATAALMNLLSVAAAFGVVTAVFQDGIGASLLGVDRTGPIEAFLPVMVFAILFGLSMDYEVFLVSRIFEEWHRRRDNREAVVHGLSATGRTITAAAAIMILVFFGFILGGERVIKLFGVGLGSAVLLDAVIVRSIIVPGLMLLLGKGNWWLPRWLDRVLPRLNVEASEAVSGAGPVAPPVAEPEPAL